VPAHGRKQYRGAGNIHVRVAGQVREASGSQPDQRRLMADHVGARHHPPSHLGVADVADDEVEVWRQASGQASVTRGARESRPSTVWPTARSRPAM
jgi:hypothetical protein